MGCRFGYVTKSILILYAHPRHDGSVANKAMRQYAAESHATTLVDLYAEYPTFEIDVAREQDRLDRHDIIVFQHPIFWYSAPAIVKEWQDLVLQHGYAYGANGDKLRGKVTLNVVTSGGSDSAYSSAGTNNFSLRELLRPFEQTANLCGMIYLPPFVLYKARSVARSSGLDAHIRSFKTLLQNLGGGHIDLDAARHASVLNDCLPPNAVGGGR